jgi:hypothetical protein
MPSGEAGAALLQESRLGISQADVVEMAVRLLAEEKLPR